MIIFEKLKFRNFLSIGNKFITIDYLKNTKKVYMGTNGSGKSSMQDALFFALYNKAFRKIKKDQLVNNINAKNLEVELTFSIGNKKYRIERGIMPIYCRLYIDDKLKEINSNARDYQSFIENTILRMSEKTFRQIVVLGSDEYIPFMKLLPYVKRAVVEDLLNVSIFSSMSDVIKNKATTCLKDLSNINNKIDVIENKIEANENNLALINGTSIDNDVLYNNKKIELQQELTTSKTILSLAIKNLPNFKSQIKNCEQIVNKHKKNINKIKDIKSKIENNKNRATKESKFLIDNNNCHVCLQDINENFKNNIIENNRKSIEEYSSGIKDLEILINDNNFKIDDCNNLILAATDKIDEIKDLEYDLELINNKYESHVSNKTTNVDNNLKIQKSIKCRIETSKKDLNLLLDEKIEYSDLANILSYLSTLLKDDGIKSKIIKTYLPIINKLMQKYLDILGMNIKFEFNEHFEEFIIAKHMENFSYGNFSTGQKLRIDLAILFLWRELAKIKNSTSTNLLILDEITSSSMDSAGIEVFNSIIDQQLNKGDTVIIITHSPETISGKEHVIYNHKLVNNFTEVVETKSS